MRQDWIEFEGQSWGKFLVRPDYVSWVSSHKEFSAEENKDIYYTTIHVEDGSDYGENMYTPEPYEQVKQKIMDAERVDLSDVVVEHFTRDEYSQILSGLEALVESVERDYPDEDKLIKIYRGLIGKVNEILKEDK